MSKNTKHMSEQKVKMKIGKLWTFKQLGNKTVMPKNNKIFTDGS